MGNPRPKGRGGGQERAKARGRDVIMLRYLPLTKGIPELDGSV